MVVSLHLRNFILEMTDVTPLRLWAGTEEQVELFARDQVVGPHAVNLVAIRRRPRQDFDSPDLGWRVAADLGLPGVGIERMPHIPTARRAETAWNIELGWRQRLAIGVWK